MHATPITAPTRGHAPQSHQATSAFPFGSPFVAPPTVLGEDDSDLPDISHDVSAEGYATGSTHRGGKQSPGARGGHGTVDMLVLKLSEANHDIERVRESHEN